MSDHLFSTQSYWVQAYAHARLHNITQNARITNVIPVRVESDKYYDAVTLRVYATSLDYTIADDTQKVVTGSRTKERSYSEYWTLIRGSARSGKPRTDALCPNCGAALNINMAGFCEYCRAKITSGAFDWVLSQIEQDDDYAG